MKLLPPSFYRRSTKHIARDLLGKTLCRRFDDGSVQRARIVETEAYLGADDAACHSFGHRRTERVRSMYLPGGHAYIYLIYGMYDCLNVVTKSTKEPEAVLIRAIEPLDFVPLGKVKKTALPTNGPGKLCRFWKITRAHDGLALFTRKSAIWIEEGERTERIVATTRVGVDYAGDAAAWPLRFYLEGNPFVSKR